MNSRSLTFVAFSACFALLAALLLLLPALDVLALYALFLIALLLLAWIEVSAVDVKAPEPEELQADEGEEAEIFRLPPLKGQPPLDRHYEGTGRRSA